MSAATEVVKGKVLPKQLTGFSGLQKTLLIRGKQVIIMFHQINLFPSVLVIEALF